MLSINFLVYSLQQHYRKNTIILFIVLGKRLRSYSNSPETESSVSLIIATWAVDWGGGGVGGLSSIIRE